MDQQAFFESDTESEGDAGSRHARITRLMQIVQEIRNNPHQELSGVLKRLDISKSQFYKDRTALGDLGFRFSYRKRQGFIIERGFNFKVQHPLFDY